MKSSGIILVLALGVVIIEVVDCQSIRVQCKRKFPSDDWLYCTENVPLRNDVTRCIVNPACSHHTPIYEFTSFHTNSTKQCQAITRCMLAGGAKICHRNRSCEHAQDPVECEQTPEPYDPQDCLRKQRSATIGGSHHARRTKFQAY